jgi:WD40 repeat protein
MAVDERGTLSAFEAKSGSLLGRVDTGSGARAMAAMPDGLCAIISRSGVAVADDEGVHRRLTVNDPQCVAWSTDGMLLVGSGDGTLTVFAGEDAPMQSEQLDEPIGAVAWHPQGFWIVAAGITVYRLDPAGLERITGGPADMPIGSIACAQSGHIAMRLGDKTALVLQYPSRETDATISYFDRDITDVCFGPDPWLGIGMNLGDGNKINLETGATHRTDTHPGRDHHSWALSVSTGKARGGDPVPAEAGGDQAPVEYSKSDTIVGIIALAVIAAIIYYLVT